MFTIQNEDMLDLVIEMRKDYGPPVIKDPGDGSVWELVGVGLFEALGCLHQLRRHTGFAVLRVVNLP